MAISYVQGSSHANGASSSTTVAVTLTSTVGGGHALCVCVGYNTSNGAGTVSVTDDKSNTYTSVTTTAISGATYSIVTFYATGISNNPQTVTATLTIANTFATIFVDEFSGIATNGPLDGHSSNNGDSTTITPGSITTVNNGDLIWSPSILVDGVGYSSFPSAGFNAGQQVSSTFFTQYEVQATAGAVNPSLTAASTDFWGAAIFGLPAAVAPTIWASVEF